MRNMNLEEYKEYMTNPCNIGKCETCPENREMKDMSRDILPCGQYHCWIRLGCREE